MRISSKRVFMTAALALIAAVVVGLFPLSTQAADQPKSSPDSPVTAWYGNCAYTVIDGDDLFHIAMRFGVTPYYLYNTNRLYNPNFIYRGMVMQVPCAPTYPQTMYRAPGYNNYRPPAYNNYQPQYNNTYRPQYNNTYQPQYNNSYPQNGYGSSGYSNYPSNGYTVCNVHYVQRGEWLKLIAGRFGVSWQAIAGMNRLYNPNFIFAGERLLIPCAQGSAYSPYNAPSNGYQPSPYVNPAPNNVVPPTAGAFMANMQNIMFNPATITIHVGQTVAWHNMDQVQHSATQGSCNGNTCTQAGGGFDTGILGGGQTSGAITFGSAGTFHFYCRVHGAAMQGDVVVMP